MYMYNQETTKNWYLSSHIFGSNVKFNACVVACMVHVAKPDKQQQSLYWRADDGPLQVVFVSPHQQPLTRLSGSAREKLRSIVKRTSSNTLSTSVVCW